MKNTPKNLHTVYETVVTYTTYRGIRMADVAVALGRQQSALQRSLSHNPTTLLLIETAWALGCDWMYLAVPVDQAMDYARNVIRWQEEYPAGKIAAAKQNNRTTRRLMQVQRAQGHDPLDRDQLAQVYPAAAIAGANGQPLDSRYIESEPEIGERPVGYIRTPKAQPSDDALSPEAQAILDSQSQGTANAASTIDPALDAAIREWSDGPQTGSAATQTQPGHDAPGEEPFRFQNPAGVDYLRSLSYEDRRDALSDGLPEHLAMSDTAIAGHYSFKAMEQAGWQLKDMIEAGYVIYSKPRPTGESA